MKYILFFVLVALSANARAQINSNSDLLSLFSNGDKIVKKAIDSTICIIRQEYKLKHQKNQNEYGIDDKSYFGYNYGIGVLTNNGIEIDGKITTPWLFDKNFDQKYYGDTLKPVLSAATFKRLTGDKFLNLKTPEFNNSDKKSIILYDVTDKASGIRITKITKDTTGWLAMVTVKKEGNINDPSQFITSVYKPVITLAPDTKNAYIKNAEKYNIVGGVYYSCQITAGRVQFFAAGLMKKNEKGWYIEYLADKITLPPTEPKNKLTPLNTNDSTKVNIPVAAKADSTAKDKIEVKGNDPKEDKAKPKAGSKKNTPPHGVPDDANDEIAVIYKKPELAETGS